MEALSETECKEFFDVFDLDKSGEISTDELFNVLKQCCPKCDEATLKKASEDMVAQCDTDKSKGISWSEFKKALGL